MFSKTAKVFPVGSVVVKEKKERRQESQQPILYTVMTKREKGYNPTVGDWEFSVVSGDGKTLQAEGRLDNCQACHLTKPESDFIFRSYLQNKE